MRDDELLRRFLLGEMDTEEEVRLEARLIQDPELFEQAEAVEADLLDEFAHGELFSAAQRTRLQRHLAASPATRSQLAMVRAITEVTELAPVLTGPWWRQELSSPWFRTLAAAMLVIAVLASWLDHRTNLLQSDIEMMTSVRFERADIPPPPPPPPDTIITPPAATPPPVIVQLFQLALSATRGADDIETLRVQPETDRVDFRFPLLPGDEKFPAYRVAIANAGTGEKLIRRDDLHPVKDGKDMVLLLPIKADQLQPGSYEAHIQGIPAEGEPEDLGFPRFKVASPEMNPQG